MTKTEAYIFILFFIGAGILLIVLMLKIYKENKNPPKNPILEDIRGLEKAYFDVCKIKNVKPLQNLTIKKIIVELKKLKCLS